MDKGNLNFTVISKLKSIRISKVTVFLFLLSLTLSFILTIGMTINKRNVEKLNMEQLIMEKSMKIHDVISKLLYKTEAISALIVQSNGSIENFELIAESIIDDPAILNFLIAPAGIVSYVYPLEGNESVIGLDFFEEGAGNREAVLAKETGQLVFGGPFNIVQGGQALVGRLPVYLKSTRGIQSFWGIVSVTLKYPESLDSVKLDDIKKDGFSYVVWRINPDDQKEQIIAMSDNYNHNKNLRYTERHIRILNAHWYFRIASEKKWYQYGDIMIFALISLCVSFLISFSIHINSKLTDTKSELDTKVSEATFLTEELNEARKQTEQMKTFAKRSFLSDINHDMRTSLSGIIGFAELATDDNIDPVILKEYMNKIKNSADGFMAIIDDMFSISKIESEETKVEKIPFDIYKMVVTCGAISELKVMEKELNLSVCMNPPVSKNVLGDPAKLRRILLQLLSNSIKSTSKGFISFSVTARNKKKTKLLLILRLKTAAKK